MLLFVGVGRSCQFVGWLGGTHSNGMTVEAENRAIGRWEGAVFGMEDYCTRGGRKGLGSVLEIMKGAPVFRYWEQAALSDLGQKNSRGARLWIARCSYLGRRWVLQIDQSHQIKLWDFAL